jgi:hypothetical protein
MVLPLLLAGLLLAPTLLSSSSANAKTSQKIAHSYERVWPSAVRFVRIDEGMKIIEKDADTGYVLFELKDEGKRFQGSIEVIRHTDRDERKMVELVVRIQKRPSYMEHAMLDRLIRKLQEELGRPRPGKRPRKEPPQKDDDKDTGKDKNAPEADNQHKKQS